MCKGSETYHNQRFDARRSASTSSTTHESRPVYVCSTTMSRPDSNFWNFLKVVSHSTGAHSCDLYTESTDSDSDSPDDDQASADAGGATVNAADTNETDYCEVCLVAQREPGPALVPCGHQRFCEAWIRHLQRIGSGCPTCRAGINMFLRLFWHFALICGYGRTKWSVRNDCTCQLLWLTAVRF